MAWLPGLSVVGAAMHAQKCVGGGDHARGIGNTIMPVSIISTPSLIAHARRYICLLSCYSCSKLITHPRYTVLPPAPSSSTLSNISKME